MADLTTRSPSGLIKDYLLAQPGGHFTGWSFFIGKLPASPDKVISIFDQSGPAGIPNLLVDFPGLQFLVRGEIGAEGYMTGWLMSRKIRDMILGHPGHPPQFLELDSVTERGTIVPMGYDDKDRHTWSSNYQLIIEPAANVLTYRESL